MTLPAASPIPSAADPAAARASLAEVAAVRERLVAALDPVIVGQHRSQIAEHHTRLREIRHGARQRRDDLGRVGRAAGP